MDALQLCVPLLLADLQFALVQDLEDDVVEGCLCAEGLLKVGVGCDGAFGYVYEDVGDLEDVVKIGFDAGAPFEDFVFVAGYLVAFLA